MNIERLRTDKPIPYIPQYAGEREKAADPAYAPVTFHLLPMTVAQYEESGELLREAGPETAPGPARYRVRPELEEEILAGHVARIENLSFGDGTPIADGTAFAEARKSASGALAPLYLEVLAAIRDISVLREGERKN